MLLRRPTTRTPTPTPIPDPTPNQNPAMPRAPPATTILAAERAHLHGSRESLRLMREDVLSLRALGGDPVSEEYLKADLYRRAEALKDLPDTPLFFGRLDYAELGQAPGDWPASTSTSAGGTCTTRPAHRS